MANPFLSGLALGCNAMITKKGFNTFVVTGSELIDTRYLTHCDDCLVFAAVVT